MFKEWQFINVMRMEELCREKEASLRREHLDPLLKLLWPEDDRYTKEIKEYDVLEAIFRSAFSLIIEEFDRSVKRYKSLCNSLRLELEIVSILQIISN